MRAQRQPAREQPPLATRQGDRRPQQRVLVRAQPRRAQRPRARRAVPASQYRSRWNAYVGSSTGRAGPIREQRRRNRRPPRRNAPRARASSAPSSGALRAAPSTRPAGSRAEQRAALGSAHRPSSWQDSTRHSCPSALSTPSGPSSRKLPTLPLGEQAHPVREAHRSRARGAPSSAPSGACSARATSPLTFETIGMRGSEKRHPRGHRRELLQHRVHARRVKRVGDPQPPGLASLARQQRPRAPGPPAPRRRARPSGAR